VQSIGTDIDLDAIQIANANAKENGLDMKNYLPPLMESADDESQSLLMKAHANAQKQFENRPTGNADDDTIRSLADILLPKHLAQPTHDIVVANILAGPLVALSSTIASLVRPGGRLAMSGILPQQGDMVVEAYSEYFDDCKVEKEMGGWILVTGIRKER
jgi:ribosomal protein L11 methylase PrmA